MRDFLRKLTDLLDANPELPPCLMVQDGVWSGHSYLKPNGWDASLCEPQITWVRRGARGTVWGAEHDNGTFTNGWSEGNYNDAREEKVILVPIT